MKIRELFNQKEVVVSFEIFPPKSTSSIQTIYDTLEGLKNLQPDYISVTYGAGGNAADNKTVEIASLIKNQYGIEALAHLTCITSTEAQIEEILTQLEQNNIENILALRGDLPKEGIDRTVLPRYRYASELVQYIKQKRDFCIAGACYPEKHLECESFEKDLEHLKFKVDQGVDFLVSQLFFDNNLFYNFLVEADKKDINVPIQAGIMPVTSRKQIERIISLCGATLPEKFRKIMYKYEHNPEALRDAGIAYAVEQIIDLISSGCRGVHIYTMNSPYVADKIMNSINKIVQSINVNAG